MIFWRGIWNPNRNNTSVGSLLSLSLSLYIYIYIGYDIHIMRMHSINWWKYLSIYFICRLMSRFLFFVCGVISLLSIISIYIYTLFGLMTIQWLIQSKRFFNSRTFCLKWSLDPTGSIFVVCFLNSKKKKKTKKNPHARLYLVPIHSNDTNNTEIKSIFKNVIQ